MLPDELAGYLNKSDFQMQVGDSLRYSRKTNEQMRPISKIADYLLEEETDKVFEEKSFDDVI